MKSYVWHPNTQMKEWDHFKKIKKGNGVWLIDNRGNKILDGVASMWCNVWGHSKKELINAIIKQSKILPHSSLFNLTHEPAEKLANKLIKISPNMNNVFYSDDGSTAMEISFKIALQYWKNNKNIKKTKLISLENGYHGDTFGAMSVGYAPEFFSNFKKQLFTVIKIPLSNKKKIKLNHFEKHQEQYFDQTEKIFKNNDKIAALVMESGAQLAGGVKIYPDKFQYTISKLCKKYNILLILDEIATGFGRLGSLIQYKEQKSIPDIVAYGKMLTGGYLTLATTLTSKKIYTSFLGNFNDKRHLFHGHTYTGNPIAAAVAIENLNLYKKNKLINKIKITSKIFKKRSNEIENINGVKDVRTKGLLMGIELVHNKSITSINKKIFDEGIKNKIYLRTLGNIIMLVPPLNITKYELNFLIDKTILTIKNIKM